MLDNVGHRFGRDLIPIQTLMFAPPLLAFPYDQGTAFSSALSFVIIGVHRAVATLPALPAMFHPVSKLVAQLSGWKPIWLLISNREIHRKAFCLEHS